MGYVLQAAFHSTNLDEWTRNLSMLLRDSVKQEVISREKKDRRDFDKLAALATSLGLYRYPLHQSHSIIINLTRKFLLFFAVMHMLRFLCSVRSHSPTIGLI